MSPNPLRRPADAKSSQQGSFGALPGYAFNRRTFGICTQFNRLSTLFSFNEEWSHCILELLRNGSGKISNRSVILAVSGYRAMGREKIKTKISAENVRLIVAASYKPLRYGPLFFLGIVQRQNPWRYCNRTRSNLTMLTPPHSTIRLSQSPAFIFTLLFSPRLPFLEPARASA